MESGPEINGVDAASTPDPSDCALPFFVTRWVEQYGQQLQGNKEASRKLRLAAAQIASALGDVGAFGSTIDAATGESQPRRFADVKRQWSASCEPERLEHVLQAATTSGEEEPPTNLLLAVKEKKRSGTGRHLAEQNAAAEPLPRASSLWLAPSNASKASLSRQKTECQQLMQQYLQSRQDLQKLEAHIASDRAIVERLVRQQRELITHSYQQLPAALSSHDIERVKAQKKREIEANEPRLTALQSKVASLQQQAMEFAARTRNALLNHRTRSTSGMPRRTFGYSSVPRLFMSSPRALFASRMSYASTINTHLTYPIYCLRFDRTGRYFITGADDYLVKVFKVATFVPASARWVDASNRCSPRGAILVCTLRGHAGVINDIDVSSDNAFLATASEDGDCRVWGLSDGRPIAILRGHTSANMVSWSRTTPCRLVTVATDGFAREWDIRDACLKRYAAFVGSRDEYRLGNKDLATRARTSSVVELFEYNGNEEDENESRLIPLPPLPHRGALIEGEQAAAPEVPLPPLPEAPGQPGDIQEASNQNGDFVANDLMDEGVQLVSKLQHGASLDERLSRAPTRARRTAVKVICVDRCPNGRHFATGSDDGVCRIWRETDDGIVEKIDGKALGHDAVVANQPPKGSSLLRTLKGHLAAITDLHYSNRGDRLLTASQEEGMVRVWSWTKDPAFHQDGVLGQREARLSHVDIKFTDPKASTANGSAESRRAGHQALISCDVAKWLPDDSKVVTAQSQLIKQSGTDIVAGSQYIFVWESSTGRCLLGIDSAHSMPCQVLLPHPKLPTILCSAGMDGLAKIWDLETGDSVLVHRNVLEFGPVPESSENGRPVGFLDGDFSEDGDKLVLTDESGRLTLFDCYSSTAPHPYWTKEQYFANDYYELAYDRNGYCVERGSERPPHLAPKGVRCSHQGTAFSPSVNELFRSLVGPAPLSERKARQERVNVRYQYSQVSNLSFSLPGNLVGNFDKDCTIMIDGGSRLPEQPGDSGRQAAARNPASVRTNSQSNSESLSSNWRWRDYSDVLQEDDDADIDAMDEDDEDFELDRTPRRAFVDSDSDLDSDDDLDDDAMLSDDEDGVGRAQRASSRRAGTPRRFDEGDSSDDDLACYMSSNNSPSGAFVRDYQEHFWKMKSSQIRLVDNRWLERVESSSSYLGRKDYAPQVGDEVIYIPRAHNDTLKQYPGAFPWDEWPEDVAWPVVKCSVLHVRYRFPMKRYFSGGRSGSMRSTVVILTLQVVGAPERVENRRFPWSAPTFAAPSADCIFAVKLFLNDNTDYVIPFDLYRQRLLDLEEALTAGEAPSLVVYYADGSSPDVEYKPYGATFDSVSAEDGILTNPHLCESGYKTVQVRWTEDDVVDSLSPWEVTVTERPDVARPCLTEEQQRRIRRALDEVRSMDSDGVFATPVDLTRYSDYANMVEVPMDFVKIATRADAGFYGSILSVVSDANLVHENCVKYNGADDDLSRFAMSLVDKFERVLLDVDELEEQRTVVEKTIELAKAQPTFDACRKDDADGAEEQPWTAEPFGVRRSSRRRTGPSQLEATLSTPGTRLRLSARRRELEARRRDRDRSRRAESRHRRAAQQAPSVLETSGPRLDHSNVRGRHSLRGRSLRAAPRGSMNETAIAQRASRALNEGADRQRHSSRLRRLNAANRNADDDLLDTSDEDVEQQAHRPQRSQRTNWTSSRSDLASSLEGDVALPMRRSRTRGASSQSTLKDSSSDEDTKPDSRPTRRNERTAASDPSDVSSESSEPSIPSDSESDEELKSDILTGRSARTNTQRRRVAAASGSESEIDSSPTRRARRSTQQKRKGPSPDRSSPRKATRGTKKPQYQDLSASDIDMDSDSHEGTSYSRQTKRQRRDGRRQSGRSESSKENGEGTHRWPDISLKKVTSVAKRLLAQLRDLDDENLFELPVAEQYPEMAKAYRKRVKHPMDFATIEESRLPRYRRITELQDDLVLTFQNCIDFNGPDSDFSGIARMMLDTLNDAFTQVCLDEGVRLPSHW